MNSSARVQDEGYDCVTKKPQHSAHTTCQPTVHRVAGPAVKGFG